MPFLIEAMGILLLGWFLGLAILLIALLTAYRLITRNGITPPGAFSTAIVIPCQGTDPTFDRLLSGLARQDLRQYRLYFTVADPADTATPQIEAFLHQHPDLGQLVVSPYHHRYSGKIANMLGGMEQACREGAEVLVFLDSDTVPAVDFVRHLVAPLCLGQAMLTTGARVLVPETGSLPEWVASLWLQASLPGVSHPQWGSAWGGAMALPMAVATDIDLFTIWQDAFSDDHTLSREIRHRKGRIAFVPRCTIANPIHYNWAETIDFLIRQLMALRIHDPRLWWLTWIMVYPLFLVFASMFQLLRGNPLLAGLTLSALLPAVAGFYIVNEVVGRRFADRQVQLRKQPLWLQLTVVPALIVIHVVASVRTALTRSFTWRGHTYAVGAGRIVRMD